MRGRNSGLKNTVRRASRVHIAGVDWAEGPRLAGASAKLAAAKSKLQDLQEDALDRAKVAAQGTDEYVRDNPRRSVGAATAVGFVVGLPVSRR